MIAEKLYIDELVKSYEEISSQLLRLAEKMTEEEFTAIPFEGSWTAAQVCEHIIKSNKSIVNALKAEGKLVARNADQRIPELKSLFLDFTNKFQSPAPVVPTQLSYKKETFVYELKKTTEDAKELSKAVNEFEAINVPGFGELTKLELLYFIIFHTQRHIQQLKKVVEKVVSKH
ncbi:DinB family protein [Segetibacter aerophilus]|uniref:DinB-like domain-containing protein n=1 Tax=Segetibacter aerophilus TaxID=670293 RepID=A0A512BAV0_9BACT|nr:DinB family protein [Segetibacter aerophilus]GEO09089.1 hypothetical protein SAE01_15850 [Segetibacter aerophilus]